MDYEEMLKKAMDKLPKNQDARDRFEIPKVKGHIEGNKTILSNFMQIANAIGREPEHLLKYVLKELATPGEFRKNAVILQRKVSANIVNEKIVNYVDNYVMCRECKRPDTKLSKESGVTFIKCQACGARYPIASKI